jgi:hypothetical protein
MSADSKAAGAKTAAEICKRFPLSQDAVKLLRDGMEPRPFLDLLIEKLHHADAVRFLAHSMPKREAIWWACLCSRPAAGGAAVPPPVAAAQKAAEDWITAPNDEKRRAAHVAAQAAGVGTPAGLTCEAVFFSEGSLGPPQFQAVPPPEHLAATMAANAIILAAVADPAKAAAKYGQCLALGKDVAAGKNRWK